MERNFAYLEARARRGRRAEPGGARLPARGRDRHPRSPLEDPLDAQLRPAVGDAQPAGGHGEDPRQGRRGAPRPPPELGLGPQLGLDRGALADEEGGPGRRRAARPSSGPTRAGEIVGALEASERGRRFIDERVEPYQRSSAGTPSGATSSSSRPSASRWSRSSSSSAATSRPTTTTRRRSSAMRRDIEAAAKEILEGLEGEALEEMRAANEINLRMAPLTPDHHFYIDQGANAHVRLVLIAIGRKLVEAGRLDAPGRRHLPPLQRAARASSATRPRIDGRAIVAERRGRARGGLHASGRATGSGTVTPTQLAFPYLVTWGFPDQFYRKQSDGRRPDQRARRLAGRRRGHRPGRPRRVDEFDEVRDGDILVCQMTNPAWVVLFTKIVGLVTDAGGTMSHPAVLVPRVRHPGRRRDVRGDRADQDRRPGPGRRHDRRGRDPRRRARSPAAGRDRRTDRDRHDSPMPRSRAASSTTRSRTACSQAILDGRYPPDARIVETQVARELGTSQAPGPRGAARPRGARRRRDHRRSGEPASAGRRRPSSSRPTPSGPSSSRSAPGWPSPG